MNDFQTPLIRLGNLFPNRAVFAKCEFLAPSGSFKIRGAIRLMTRLSQEGRKPQLVVPSAGNTAVGAAVGAKALGFPMIGVVPKTIAKAKDDKLKALGVELVKIDGVGSELLRRATEVAQERGGYFVHPHLDPNWTDGYREIAAEVIQELPECQSIVFPLGGGGLLMGLSDHLRTTSKTIRLVGVEPHNYPKYAPFTYRRTPTIADGLIIETPHPSIVKRIEEDQIEVAKIHEADIRAALRNVFQTQGWQIEPSSAVALACVQSRLELPEPICVIVTGQNVSHEELLLLMTAPR